MPGPRRLGGRRPVTSTRAPGMPSSADWAGPWLRLWLAGSKAETAVEAAAAARVAHGDGGVVDAELQALGPFPHGPALARRKVDQLERMAVGVAKLVGVDAGGECGGAAGRDRGGGPHACGGGVHGADHDREVLEPEVVTAAAGRVGRAGAVPPDQLELVITKAQADRAGGGAGEQGAGNRGFERAGMDAAEAERVAVEGLGPVEVGDDPADAGDPGRAPAPTGGQAEQNQAGPQFQAHRRSLMRSATRMALAMMVSVGFTAPIEGKKLASTT